MKYFLEDAFVKNGLIIKAIARKKNRNMGVMIKSLISKPTIFYLQNLAILLDSTYHSNLKIRLQLNNKFA